VAKKTGKLTRADLEKIVDGMSARDMFQASPSGEVLTEEQRGMKMAERIFDISAERQGWGEGALDRVSLGDGPYLSGLLGEALNVGGPKVNATDQSLPSADTGDSAPS